MKYFILLVISFMVLSAECVVEKKSDKINDRTDYVFSCETNGNVFYMFSKSNTPDFKDCYIKLADNPNNPYKGMFGIGGMNDYSNKAFQNITLRIDKNKPFHIEADLFNNSKNANFYPNKNAIEQLKNGNKLLVRYESFNEAVNTIEINISGLKKFTKRNNTINSKIKKIIFKKFTICCENEKHVKKANKSISRQYMYKNKCIPFYKPISVKKVKSNSNFTQIEAKHLGNYWCENSSFF